MDLYLFSIDKTNALGITITFLVLVFCAIYVKVHENAQRINNTNLRTQTDDAGFNAPGTKCYSLTCIRCLNRKYQVSNLNHRLKKFGKDRDCLSKLIRVESSLAILEIENLKEDEVNITGMKSRQLPTRDECWSFPEDSFTNMDAKGDSQMQKPTVFKLYGLKTVPFHDTHSELSGDINLLLREDTLNQIAGEFKDIVSSSVGWSTNESDDGLWKLFYLYNQGAVKTENCEKCPETYGIINSLNNFMPGSVFGNACFSVVYPGTHIKRHTGPTNCRLRCHIPISCDDKCYIEVASKSETWRKGKALVFDDSFPHSVTHKGTKARGVLIVDFWHPELTHIERDCLNFIFN